MGSYRITIICILAALSTLTRPVAAQETQDAFAADLIAACLEENNPKVKDLVTEHRLWVKPVVNQLISDYIHRTMTGSSARAAVLKDAATLISQTFEETYGEKSLSIATAYLDTWGMEQLGKKAQADRIYGIATDLRKSGQQTDVATTKFLQALDLYTDIGDVRGQGEVLGGLGFIYWSIDSDTCLSYYQKALKAREKVDDKQLMGASLSGIGLVHYWFYSDFKTAIEYLEKACEIFEEIGDNMELGNSLSYMAMCYEEGGEPELALKYYSQSFIFNQKAGNLHRMAEAKLHSGTILNNSGKYLEALDNLDISLNIYLELKDTLMMGDVYTQMAMLYAHLGDFETAIKKASKAFEFYEAVNEFWGLAGAYNNTGIVLNDVGRYQKASEYLEKALEIYTELEDRGSVAYIMNNLGNISFKLNDFAKAEEYYQRSLNISREIKDETGELHSMLNLANAKNRLGNLDEAFQIYESASDLCSQLNNLEIEWKILVGLAENYKLRGEYSKAIEYNEAGLSKIEELRNTLYSEEYKSSYLARERYVFEDVIHMLAELHEREPGKEFDLLAFEYAQRCKSRSFLDQLENTSSADTANTNLPAARPSSLMEIQNSGLEKYTVLLEYSLGDTCSYLWVITKDQHQLFKLPDRKTLEEKVETFRFAILNPDQDNKAFLEQSGYYLYKHLIQPAESFFSKKSNLVILPDGILNYVPFEVLITEEADLNSENPYYDLSFLVKKYPISYSQSASVIKSLIQGRRSGGKVSEAALKLIAFGDPVYEDESPLSDMTRKGFSRLTHSSDEVVQIAGYFEEENAKIYVREEANEVTVKQEGVFSNYSYIHFATHGLINEKNPENSSLVLSQVNNTQEDGFLQASEIIKLDLDAELVVLSACQTGLGKMIRGEGIIGISRAFMYAGSPSVVMSLWSVSDYSTSIFMQRYYKNLIRQGKSKTQALRIARISMINEKEYAHPFYWAPFVLTGDWQ